MPLEDFAQLSRCEYDAIFTRWMPKRRGSSFARSI